MSQAAIDAAIARGLVAAEAIEGLRLELEAVMRRALPLCGLQGFKALVAGVELRVIMERNGAARD
jgi:hypothetical protein